MAYWKFYTMLVTQQLVHTTEHYFGVSHIFLNQIVVVIYLGFINQTKDMLMTLKDPEMDCKLRFTPVLFFLVEFLFG